MCVALDVVQNDLSISYDFTDGTHFHMHASAVGKAILAQYSDDHVTEILDRYGMPAHTENTITDRDELKEVFEQIRESDVSFDHEEYRMGWRRSRRSSRIRPKPYSAVSSITGPAHRLREPDVEEELRRELLSARNIIELNYSSSDATT